MRLSSQNVPVGILADWWRALPGFWLTQCFMLQPSDFTFTSRETVWVFHVPFCKLQLDLTLCPRRHSVTVLLPLCSDLRSVTQTVLLPAGHPCSFNSAVWFLFFFCQSFRLLPDEGLPYLLNVSKLEWPMGWSPFHPCNIYLSTMTHNIFGRTEWPTNGFTIGCSKW